MLKKDDIKNIDFLIAKKEIKERFEKILTNLRKTVEGNGHAVQTIERFRGCLNIEHSDVSQLPLFSPTPFSHACSKINCILCEISFSVQMYWALCTGEKVAGDVIGDYLSRLENYAAKGLAAFKIIGYKYPKGYYLEEI